MNAMQAFGFLVTLEAIPGRQDDVIEFLEKARHLVEAERGTIPRFDRGPRARNRPV